MKLAMIVTLSGVVGLTKAYRSVLSATGSWLISGASRWLEACVGWMKRVDARPATARAASPAQDRRMRLVLVMDGFRNLHDVYGPGWSVDWRVTKRQVTTG